MARGGRGGNLSSYERRILNRTGMLPAQARARGISLAAARGHAARRLTPEGPIVREHQLRELRRAERGDLSEGDRGFIRRQAKRSGRDAGELAATFRSYRPQKRAAIREMQTYARRRHVASKGKFRIVNDAPARYRQAYEGGGGVGGGGLADYLGGFGGSVGGGDLAELDEADELDEPDFAIDGDYYPDDLDEVDDAFMLYH